MSKVLNLKESADWEKLKSELLAESEIIIFKHSPRCGVSLFIEREFDAWFKNLKADNKPIVAKINVISERPLSQKIAQELEIRHESPQAIWIDKSGKVKWHASHHSIDKSELTEILSN